ncbi:MAG: alcohol dehydrogenase catalytic domain-containing protein [Desulfobacterales bacterium]|nr:MAG: alcohol dehydrogenase catalytic domain-containing protein [Desulfobacterales bacterium]
MKALQFSVSLTQWIALKTFGIFNRKFFYRGPLAAVKLVDIPEPELPSEEWVKVETLLCGFCASDLNLIFLKESPTASPFTSFPCVIGHEVCGRVAELGSRVNDIKPGDVVTVAPALNCAARQIDPPCPACSQGMVANCENYANGNLAPGLIIGLCADTGGGFAPYFVAHESQIFKLPEGCSPEEGVLVEPLSVGLQAVYSNMPQKGDKVLIIGGGVIGTMVLKAIRGLDIDCHVAVADPSVFAADLVKKAGADHIITDGNVFENTLRLTGAKKYKPMMGQEILMGGFARIYDTVGSPQTLNMAMRCLAAGGILSQVGIWHDVKLDLTPLWLKQQTLKGVYGCGYAAYKGEWMHMFDIALNLVREGKVKLNDMITHTFSLENFEEMIAVNLVKGQHQAVKTAVSFVS